MKLSNIALIMAMLPVAAFAKTDESLYNKSDAVKGYIGFNAHYLRAQLNDAFGEEVGHAFGYDTYTDELINPNHFGLSLNAGVQFNEYFGVEGFLQKINNSTAELDFYHNYTGNKIANYKSKTSALAFGADLMGYIPVPDTKFSFIGSLGLGYYKFDGKFDIDVYGTKVSDSDEESNIAFRIGIGGQYAFSERWALRGMVRYVAMDYDDDEDVVEGSMDVSIGARYTF